MDDDLAAIVEENIFMDDAVVFNGQVVSERDFHAVEYLYVHAAMFEDVTGEHGAHPKAQQWFNPTGERSYIIQNQMSGLRSAYFTASTSP